MEIKEINFPPGQHTGAHLHPCPVVGYIATGGVIFQIDGQAPQTLRAGDAFYEPPNAKIVRFDAIDQPTKFIAYYLLGKDDRELIHSLATARSSNTPTMTNGTAVTAPGK